MISTNEDEGQKKCTEEKDPIVLEKKDEENEVTKSVDEVVEELSIQLKNECYVSDAEIDESIETKSTGENWSVNDKDRVIFDDYPYEFEKYGSSSSLTINYRCVACRSMQQNYDRNKSAYKRHMNQKTAFSSPGTMKYRIQSKTFKDDPMRPSDREHICENKELITAKQKVDEDKQIQKNAKKEAKLGVQGIRTVKDEKSSIVELNNSTYPNDLPPEMQWLLNKMAEVFPFNPNFRPHYLYALTPIFNTIEEIIEKTFYFGIAADLQSRLIGHKNKKLKEIGFLHDKYLPYNTVMVSLLPGKNDMMKCCDLEALLIGYAKLRKLNISSPLKNDKPGHFTTTYEIFEKVMVEKDHEDHEKMGIALNQLFEYGMRNGHRVFSSRIGESEF